MTEPPRDYPDIDWTKGPKPLVVSREDLAFWQAYAEIRFDLFNIRRRIKARRILREMGP